MEAPLYNFRLCFLLEVVAKVFPRCIFRLRTLSWDLSRQSFLFGLYRLKTIAQTRRFGFIRILIPDWHVSPEKNYMGFSPGIFHFGEAGWLGGTGILKLGEPGIMDVGRKGSLASLGHALRLPNCCLKGNYNFA